MRITNSNSVLFLGSAISFFILGRFAASAMSWIGNSTIYIASILEGNGSISVLVNNVIITQSILCIFLLYFLYQKKQSKFKFNKAALIFCVGISSIFGYVVGMNFADLNVIDGLLLLLGTTVGILLLIQKDSKNYFFPVFMVFTIISAILSIGFYINVYTANLRDSKTPFYTNDILNAVGRRVCPKINEKAKNLNDEDAVRFYTKFVDDHTALGSSPTEQKVRDYFSSGGEKPYLPLYSCGNVVAEYLNTNKNGSIILMASLNFIYYEVLAALITLFSVRILKLSKFKKR